MIEIFYIISTCMFLLLAYLFVGMQFYKHIGYEPQVEGVGTYVLGLFIWFPLLFWIILKGK